MKEIKLFKDGVVVASVATENYDKCALAWQAAQAAFLSEVDAYVHNVLGGTDNIVNIKLIKN